MSKRDSPAALLERADGLYTAGRQPEAERVLHRVVSLHPSLPGAYGRLAELTGELAHLRAAADVAPTDSRDTVLAAYALNRVGASSEALVYWRRAARLEPANAPLQNELGATARDAGAFAESLAAYRAAIAASPTNAVAYNNLAIDLKDMGDVVGARRAHGAALRASPNFSPMVHLNLLHLDLDMASWRHWPLYAWRAARQPPAGAEAEWPWSRLEARAYLSGSAALLNAAAAAEAAAVESHAAAKWEGCGRCRKRPPPLAPPGARAPLRVALLSDLDQDPSARLLARALPLLGAATRRGGRPVDAPQIEPLLLSTTAGDGSAALRQIRRGVRTVDLPPAPPAPPPSIAAQQPPPPLCEAQRVLSRERPHIILEAMSYLPQNQLVLLARKCAAAPVHASWLRNFHGSMEASFIQYAVADRIVLPPLEARGWAEAPLLMPHAHLVSSGLPADAAAAAAAAEGASSAAAAQKWPPADWPPLAATRLACSLNRLDKLDPSLLDLWRGALLRAGGVPLWLATGAGTLADGTIAHAHRALRAEALARGVAPRRLLFAARAPTAGDHLRRLPACDVALDALRWGAHATALDALGASVGVLTARGGHVASRTAASLVDALGAPATATASLRAYADAFAALLRRVDGPPAAALRAANRGRRARRPPVGIEATL